MLTMIAAITTSDVVLLVCFVAMEVCVAVVLCFLVLFNRAMDRHDDEVSELIAENARLRRLLGRDDPVECKACGSIRERSEVVCGQCTYMLDGSDLHE